MCAVPVGSQQFQAVVDQKGSLVVRRKMARQMLGKTFQETFFISSGQAL
jgi:hypothetical protein